MSLCWIVSFRNRLSDLLHEGQLPEKGNVAQPDNSLRTDLTDVYIKPLIYDKAVIFYTYWMSCRSSEPKN